MMWELDHKEGWAPKNWCFWTVVLEKTLESPLDCKEIQPVQGYQLWIFIGRSDAKAEAPNLWPPDVKNRLIRKPPDAGKGWRQEEKGMTEDEMVEWHHQLDGHEFEQAPGVGDGQGSLVCCSPWGCKESDTTERLNWTDWSFLYHSSFLKLPPSSVLPWGKALTVFWIQIRFFESRFREHQVPLLPRPHWLCPVARGISVSPTRDQTHALCFVSTEF